MHTSVTSSAGWVVKLRRFVCPPPAEFCELCHVEIPSEHPHLIDIADRRLVCACPACSILFDGRTDGKFRCVPRRTQMLTDFRLTDAEWNALHIPIGLAFLFHSALDGRPIALYPGPAGTTESFIGEEAWSMLILNNPELADLAPDVEALLVNRTKRRREYYRVSIDHCFALVGLIRTRWRGLSGGAEVWDAINAYFARLQDPRSDGGSGRFRHG